MRLNLKALFLIFFQITITLNSEAQTNDGQIVVMNYYKFQFPAEVSVPEFDSLLYIYKTNVWDKNENVLSYKILRHLWGNREKDFIILYEVRSWDDVLKVKQRNNELFEEFWKTKEERKKFDEAFNKYFDVKYPDEIYKELFHD